MTFGDRRSAIADRAVPIFGMHRSGTAARARGPSALGVDGSGVPISPGLDDPKGAIENRSAVRLDDPLLNELGLAKQSRRSSRQARCAEFPATRKT